MRRKKRDTSQLTSTNPRQPKFTAEPNHYQLYEFSPRHPLDGKSNLGRHVFIEQDGAVREIVRLNVLDDRHREDIVAYHFCMQYAEVYYGDDVHRPEFYIVGRDDPWDYRYVMHDGSRFNVEICRVASEPLLRLLKAENDCSLLLMKDELYGYEVQKIERKFPGTFAPELIKVASAFSGKHQRFKNSATYAPNRAFLRPPFNPRVDVKEILNQAIQKKLNKRHSDKEETHLILDNLTTHASATDFFEVYGNNADFLYEIPFLSVWLYTGYYSDDDGHNCEFALAPIKLSGGMERKLQSFYENKP